MQFQSSFALKKGTVMKKTNSSRGFKIALLGAALAVSSAAMSVHAASPERFQDRAGHHMSHEHGHKAHARHHGHKHMHGERLYQRAGLVVPGYGVVSQDFVDGMGLNDEQLKLIEDARKAARELREDRKERFKAEREGRVDRYKSALNPAEALKQAEERREQAKAERRKVDEKWLAVWNSLDTAQQERIGEFLKKRAEKSQERAQKFEERKKDREAARAKSDTKSAA